MTTPSYSTTESGAVIIHQHHTHNHFEDDPRMSEALDALAAMQIEQQAAAVALRTLGATTMALVDEFRAEITQLKEVRPAMEAAFAKIEAKLDAALANDLDADAMRTQLEEVRDELRDERTALAAAVVENTPADEPPPPPPLDERHERQARQANGRQRIRRCGERRAARRGAEAGEHGRSRRGFRGQAAHHALAGLGPRLAGRSLPAVVAVASACVRSGRTADPRATRSSTVVDGDAL